MVRNLDAKVLFVFAFLLGGWLLMALRTGATVSVVSPSPYGIPLGANHLLFVNGRLCIGMPASDPSCSQSVAVYTVDETNGIRDVLAGQIDSVVKDGGLVDQRVGAAESRLRSQIEASLNALPQRLLTDEAKKAIEGAVVADTNSTLEKMSQDLQGQIDQMKKDIAQLKQGH